MASILGYGCSTANGPTSQDLWSALLEGRDSRSEFSPGGPCAFLWPDRAESARERLVQNLIFSFDDMLEQLDLASRNRLLAGSKLGVIFASTKGNVDDFIWDPSADLTVDGLTPIMDEFLNSKNLIAARKVVVSNACTSGLSALYLADEWLANDDLDDVLIIAADTVGPFVMRGFECLRVLTTDAIRPFAGVRSGFHIGDAAAALFVSRHPGEIKIRGCGIDAEGFAVTRPAQSGESLKRACLAIPRLIENPPDAIIAHGTATKVNDQAEDAVYTSLFGATEQPPLITGTKWCVGHTLGASGAVDLVVAMLMIERNQVFAIETTESVDPTFGAKYIVKNTEVPEREIRSVMVSSLGFGGIHAAALIEWSGE